MKEQQKPRVGKKGGAKRVAKELTKIRKSPLSKKVYDIVDENHRRQNSDKKSAKPLTDLEN